MDTGRKKAAGTVATERTPRGSKAEAKESGGFSREARVRGVTRSSAGGSHGRVLRRLLVAAVGARKRAHAPYSGFRVGAALLGDDRKVYAGCNVENSSYGATICAERNAVVQAVARGARGVQAIAIVADTEAPTPPCGMCLQVLAEFADGELPILLACVNGAREVTSLGALLPRRFDRSYLGAPPSRGRRR